MAINQAHAQPGPSQNRCGESSADTTSGYNNIGVGCILSTI